MKYFLFSLMLSFIAARTDAQRFYYFETGNVADEMIKKGLEKSDQHVVGSVMASEYTVKTRIAGGDNEKELNLEIILADSLTQKEVFRSYEQFCFTAGKEAPQKLYETAIRSFIRRHLGQIVTTAKKDHAGFFEQSVSARKDNI